jgi:hypothetical protein
MKKRFVLLGGIVAAGALAYVQRDRIISWFLTKVFDGMDDDEQNDQVVASTPQVHNYLSHDQAARRAAQALVRMWPPPNPTSPLTGDPLRMKRDDTDD